MGDLSSFDFSRRRLLGCGLAAAADLALHGWRRCRNQVPLPNTSYEGVYTDRYTYRQGEPIGIHASLTNPQWVDFSLIRHDTPANTLVDTVAGWVPHRGNPDEAGVDGAAFAQVATIDTSGLEPGIYAVVIPDAVMQPENYGNPFHGYSSDNRFVRIVVTPPVPGSLSRILWIQESTVAVAYGAYGGQSIYGPPDVRRYTVSAARPGCTAGGGYFRTVRLLRAEGHDLEFIVFVGMGEYMSHTMMLHLERHLQQGGSLLLAASEFGAHRVRLDHATRQLTTYKFDAPFADPLWGTGDPNAAGIGMHIPETVPETALAGLTQWACNSTTNGGYVDLPLYNYDRAGWLLEETGVGNGGVLPGAIRNFTVGNRLEFGGDGEPRIVAQPWIGDPDSIVVWGAFPSIDGREWWNAPPGAGYGAWPLLADGYALATLQERPEGGRVIGLPTPQLLEDHGGDPIYDTLARNILEAVIDPD